jgi:hypothetical protein
MALRHRAYAILGYEFDIAIGRHQGKPRMRLTPVKIAVLDGDLVVTPRKEPLIGLCGDGREDRAQWVPHPTKGSNGATLAALWGGKR